MTTPSMSNQTAVQLHQDDNIAVAFRPLKEGETLSLLNVSLQEDIPKGHKVSLQPIKKGDSVIKYGQIIGKAHEDVGVGAHIHTHNLVMLEFDRISKFGARARNTDYLPEEERKTFQGYARSDGRVGTRNYVGLVTSVNCSATAAKLIAREAEKANMLADYPNVDGIVPIVHSTGCGMRTDDEAFLKLQRTIWGYATHPNFASVMMLGLGCETNQIPLMLEKYGMPPTEKFKHYTIQQLGGTRKTVAKGLEWLEEALAVANKAERSTQSSAHLTVALQCGGSDGFSGMTANPALGKAVDLLVTHGGTAALSETPEIYGAEHLLTNRAQSPVIGEKLMEHIAWWKEYTEKHGSAMNDNPAPGNKAGGLTTILEKSLGAVAKAGSTNLNGVYRYAEKIDATGLVFMDSPGYDPVSITGQVASGCNVVCFTTGRGSCYGNKPVPSIKIASNTMMYHAMSDDMDINCGTIADGVETVGEAGERIFEEIIEVASGKQTLSEKYGLGDLEFAPWQTYAQM